jgi:SAM-dependent methyltransferase
MDEQHFQRFIKDFRCPICGEALATNGRLECRSGEHSFPIEGGIPQLFVPNDWDASKTDLTAVVRQFYEKTPFPNYDDFDNVAALMQKSRKGRFARLLDEQIPLGAKVLEVGCGTGQLSNFLGIARRDVFGTDMCMNSLRLAETFRRKNQLSVVGFYQMNLFRPFFREETFDLVISNGVLHHTNDPFGGFKSISKLVRKDGYIILGLYNKFGRLMTDLRRMVFRATGKRFLAIDPYLRERGKLDPKTDTWFADQYEHPLESEHTMGEVLSWFDQTGFTFVNSIPKNLPLAEFSNSERLFEVQRRSDALTLLAVQLRMIVTGNREGGLFIMIGRRDRA